MFGRRFFYALGAIQIAYVAYIFSGPSATQEPVFKEPREWPGKNNTVLFLSNCEHGLANVLLATSHALLVEHKDLDIHYVSFGKLKSDVVSISKFAAKNSGVEKPITFHELKGPSYAAALGEDGVFMDETINEPGIKGMAKLCHNMQRFFMPWTAHNYLGVYHEISNILQEVDPIIVAVDPLFSPGLTAVREAGRNHAIISPNALQASMMELQPKGGIFWKYPALSSGYSYPLPWYLIPANIYMNLRLAYSVFVPPYLNDKKAILRENGIANPIDISSAYHEDYTWLVSSTQAIEYPLEVIPDNVVECGPIFLSTAPPSEQDPELAEWLKKAPTVLINLGSMADYDENGATEMAKSAKILLDNTKVQVLWKFNKRRNYTDEFMNILEEDLKSGRIRMSKWIDIDPAALLESGNVVLSVHHGGANCFHEAIATGVPQVVLPFWVDLFDYAVRAEYLGVGVWGSRKAAPNWTSEELSAAFLKVVGDSDEAAAMRKRALEISEPFKKNPGRVIAAHKMAKLARRAPTAEFVTME